MKTKVDLNADLGESFGPWPMGADAELLEIITSANVACGFHAGDPDVMARTMARAAENGVGIGAHPGFPDLQGFGRRKMHVTPIEARNLVAYQLGAAQGMARAAGTLVRHLKLHGALANMAAVDAGLARACYEGALAVDPDIIIMVIAGTRQEEAARALGCRIAREIFADRAYTDEGLLVDRSINGAVLHDPVEISARILAMLRAGAIITASGRSLPTQIDTICLHGDTPEAVEIARHLRDSLVEAGILVNAFEGISDHR